jgi:hypothetical protein
MRHFIGDKVFSSCSRPGCEGQVTVEGMVCYECRTLIKEKSRGGRSLGWIFGIVPMIVLISCVVYFYTPSWFK